MMRKNCRLWGLAALFWRLARLPEGRGVSAGFEDLG